MTYYGPWVQAADFEKTGGPTGAHADVIATGYLEDFHDRPILSGFYIPTGDEVITQQQQANGMNALTNPDADMPIEGPMSWAVSYNSVLMPGDLLPSIARTWMRSRMFHHPMSISPFSLGLNNYAPNAILPPGAIGWQWQSDLSEGHAKASDVVTCVLEITYTPDEGVWHEAADSGTLAGDVVTEIKALSGTFASDTLVGIAGAFYSDTLLDWASGVVNRGEVVGTMVGTGGSDPDPITLDPIDITEHLDSKGRTALGILMRFPPPPFGPFDLSVSTDVAYGYDTVPVVHWTFRPPLFRWIFEGSNLTAAPPLRRRQRDDDAINNNRNRGRSSQQHSLRNSGYL